MEMLAQSLAVLTAPASLFFILGFFAAYFRSDLSFPESIGKAMAIFLMVSIGLKGGVSLSQSLDQVNAVMIYACLMGLALSFLIPLLAYGFLNLTTRLEMPDKVAVAAHYGSVSVVTFVTAMAVLEEMGIDFSGYMLAVMALMEAPAILSALYVYRRALARAGETERSADQGHLLREIFFNGSIVLIVGSFLIGVFIGQEGLKPISPFFMDPFRGVLCLFLLDIGLQAARRLRESKGAMKVPMVAFGIYMPILSAAIGALAGAWIGLPLGDIALLATLSASASYIVVPAAMRLAVPESNPAIYMTLSLAITFPFNIIVGIPLYINLAEYVSGWIQ
jgi:hypothetical protein